MLDINVRFSDNSHEMVDDVDGKNDSDSSTCKVKFRLFVFLCQVHRTEFSDFGAGLEILPQAQTTPYHARESGFDSNRDSQYRTATRNLQQYRPKS
ncbi:hypothetical protein [Paraburkholderia antibiotica]|uniref:Uncharacterized protein n=1 Tax=Paraburkholderia antibiotica TaxID=2728839 RepID=A0A7Y0A2B5_9BURK|nr:hypothetical protein [Paraburkholderia antibiotica]NML35185.1 hypothetical protein [Paraburkholderia antibiotica]